MVYIKKYDIIVVGGGLSGVCAAITAARQGTKVLIAEAVNCFGGAAAISLVTPFMPSSTKVGEENLHLSSGIFDEIVDRLKAMGAADTSRIGFRDEFLKLILNRMVVESGADILFHATLSDAKVANGAVQSVEFVTKAGKLNFEAQVFIDGTGDADLANLSGCSTRLGREEDNLCQPMTLCFRVGNVDMTNLSKDFTKMQALYKEHQAQGKIKNPRENILLFHNYEKNVIHFNTTRVCKRNPTDPVDITLAEIEAREQVFELFNFLKTNVECFKDSELLSTALQIGVRESRMVNGDYILTGSDLVACTKFDDAIAAGNYDIDIHNPEGTGTSHYYFEEGTYYTIPYRSLIAKDTKNLLVVGRCASFDHQAQASCRIMPICATMGEAAGVAASMAVADNTDIRSIDIKKLQSTLKENGAFF